MVTGLEIIGFFGSFLVGESFTAAPGFMSVSSWAMYLYAESMAFECSAWRCSR